MNKNDHNKINDFNNDENRKKHFKSDINLDFDNHNGEKIILMNTDGRKIEDIINSINNINIDKTGEKNNINNNNEKPPKKEYLEELVKRKKRYSEHVKKIKIIKRHNSIKPKEDSSFDIIKKYSIKVLCTNRELINYKKCKRKKYTENK